VGIANHLSSAIVGTTIAFSPATQTIAFSATVTNPLLYINWSDATSSMDFTGLSLSLLDSNNAQLAGSVVSFTGSSNSINDGFVAQINGTFGPGTPIQFTYTSVPFESATFNVGLNTCQEAICVVPEPASPFLLTAGALPPLIRRLRRG
jgi:hypothetical protein